MSIKTYLSGRMLDKFFAANAIKRGRNYFHQQKVSSITEPDHANGKIQFNATVKNDYNDTYNQKVVIILNSSAKPTQLYDIRVTCSCPVGYNCKHGIAALEKFKSVYGHLDPDHIKNKIDIESFIKAFNQDDQMLDKDVKKIEQSSNEYLVYQIKKRANNNNILYVLEGYKTRILKNGTGFGKLYPCHLYSMAIGHARIPAYATELDLKILHLISHHASNQIELKHAHGTRLVQLLIETQRCFHGQVVYGGHITSGPTKNIETQWKQHNGTYQCHIAFKDNQKNYDILPTCPALYLHKQKKHIGMIDTHIPGSQLNMLQQLAQVDEQDLLVIKEKLKSTSLNENISYPKKVQEKTIEKAQCTPKLYFRKDQFTNDPFMMSTNPVFYIGELTFVYGDQHVKPLSQSQMVDIQGNYYLRDHQKEKSFCNRLLDLGFQQIDLIYAETNHLSDSVPYLYYTGQAGLSAWHDFYSNEIPKLQNQGWIIEFEKDFEDHFVEANQVITNVNASQEDADWFDISLKVEYEGQQIDIQDILVNYLSNNRHKDQASIIIKLDDGQNLHIPYVYIEPLLNSLTELYDLKPGDDLKLSKWQIGTLMSLEEQLNASGSLDYSQAENMKQLVEHFRHIDNIKQIEPHQDLNASLRDYQIYGLSWLKFLHDHQIMGILADDMGLGKTIQILAWLQYEKMNGQINKPSLIIAPTSVVGNWQKEAEKFTPGLSVLKFQGNDRFQHQDHFNEYDLIITSYPLILRDELIHDKQSYFSVILDEAQVIKNPKTKQAQTIFKLKAQQRFCLTGTPMENHLGELWSLFNFLMPGFLGTESQFRKCFRNPIEKDSDNERMQLLQKRIQPFVLRRTKDRVAKELPSKTEILTEVHLAEPQKKLYESIRSAMATKVRELLSNKGLAKSHIHILDALLKLRQSCCHPGLVKTQQAQKIKESAKLEQLLKMLDQLQEEGRKVLVFSQFVEMLEVIAKRLDEKHYGYEKLIGSTKNRQEVIDRFDHSQTSNIFLISLKAGGTGLNLVSADTVIHYDPWWNPAVENQATDRSYRIGQDKPVTVYKLIAKETLEEKIVTLQNHKAKLANQLYDQSSNQSQSKQLSESEILDLFQPINKLEAQPA